MSSEKIPSAVREGKPGSSMYPESSLGEAVEGIPTGRDVDWEPLVDYRRNGVSETTIHGAVAWAHGDEVIHSFGGNVLCYGRSMMKPIMMKTVITIFFIFLSKYLLMVFPSIERLPLNVYGDNEISLKLGVTNE